METGASTKSGGTKSGGIFLLIFRPQTGFSLQNRNQVFWCLYIAGWFPWFGCCRSSGRPRSQQEWGWVFGFCRPESFLFKCYVLGFLEASLVFSRNVSKKIEAPTPPGQFLGYIIYIYIIYIYIYLHTVRNVRIYIYICILYILYIFFVYLFYVYKCLSVCVTSTSKPSRFVGGATPRLPAPINGRRLIGCEPSSILQIALESYTIVI